MASYLPSSLRLTNRKSFRRSADQPLCCGIQAAEVEAKKNPQDYLLTVPIQIAKISPAVRGLTRQNNRWAKSSLPNLLRNARTISEAGFFMEF
jgi:hypothetical protein